MQTRDERLREASQEAKGKDLATMCMARNLKADSMLAGLVEVHGLVR